MERLKFTDQPEPQRPRQPANRRPHVPSSIQQCQRTEIPSIPKIALRVIDFSIWKVSNNSVETASPPSVEGFYERLPRRSTTKLRGCFIASGTPISSGFKQFSASPSANDSRRIEPLATRIDENHRRIVTRLRRSGCNRASRRPRPRSLRSAPSRDRRSIRSRPPRHHRQRADAGYAAASSSPAHRTGSCRWRR